MFTLKMIANTFQRYDILVAIKSYYETYEWQEA